MNEIYILIVLYPLIAALIAKFVFAASSLWGSIKEAYKFFFGVLIIYYGSMLVLIPAFNLKLSNILNLIIFSIFFFATYFIKVFISTEAEDIFAQKEVKK
ncbi:MAG: hypothetical protein ACP5HJ_01230 [Candidatus Micrarchaeia archaeon]|jgi:hypothetical protein